MALTASQYIRVDQIIRRHACWGREAALETYYAKWLITLSPCSDSLGFMGMASLTFGSLVTLSQALDGEI